MEKAIIHKIIVKFLNKEASQNELEKLDVYLKDEKNVAVFNHFVRTEYLTTFCMGAYDLKKAKESINKKVKNSKRKRSIQIYKRVSVAASILLVIGLSFFDGNDNSSPTVVKSMQEIEVGSNKAILTLGNGNQVALEKGKNYQTGSASSNGEELLYTPQNENANEKIPFNYLTIPKGGQFFVQLSDGTKVWLNSDSKLKYPTKFLKGEARNIELVYGEAYLEVSPSSANKGSAFNVVTKDQEVSVLGTEFNIKAYNDDNQISTTLVEGKILVQKGNTEKILSPNQQSKIEYDSDTIIVQEIDASQEIAWVKGIFNFNEETLDEMMKVLSRWYDVEVIFESIEHKDFVFTGILKRTKSFTDILELIEATSDGEVKFEINEKTITSK